MTDLDKMARELLAAEHEADDPASMTADRLRSGLPVMWWADPALRAIRAALLTAPPGWKLVPEGTVTYNMAEGPQAEFMRAGVADGD